jgi:DNA-binding NarL/FixJ family response regulator
LIIRILVADDSSLFLLAILDFLETAPHLKVVGSAGSGREALEQVEHLRPDLVLMDEGVPEMNGLMVTHQLKSRANASCVIMLTAYDDPVHRALAAEMGADGFVSKWDCDTELLPSVDRLFAPRPPFNRQTATSKEGGLT